MVEGSGMEEIEKQVAERARGRQQFKYGERVVYEWDQNIDDVNIYIDPPPVFKSSQKALVQA